MPYFADSLAITIALGTLGGYLGAEIVPDSLFPRLLWSSRYYGAPDGWLCLLYIAVFMPLGGPIHKEAVRTLDSFALSGLWHGQERGNMLGTAFYEDSGFHYRIRSWIGGKPEDGTKHARNASLIGILTLLASEETLPAPSGASSSTEAAREAEDIRNRRPVYVLRVSLPDPKEADPPRFSADDGGCHVGPVAMIILSEIVTLSAGLVIAVVWRDPFATWFALPLVAKLLAAFSSVKRLNRMFVPEAEATQRVKSPPNSPPAPSVVSISQNKEAESRAQPIGEEDIASASVECHLDSHGQAKVEESPPDPDYMVVEPCDYAHGFFLMCGRSALLLPYFRHIGHPIRDKSYHRRREIISMLVVIFVALIYPLGLLWVIWTPMEVQYSWLGYELYAVAAMCIYRYCGGRSMASRDLWIARQLAKDRKVTVGDISFELAERSFVFKVEQGRVEIDRLVERFAAGNTGLAKE